MDYTHPSVVDTHCEILMGALVAEQPPPVTVTLTARQTWSALGTKGNAFDVVFCATVLPTEKT